jgi:hypothetical protein
LSKYKSDGSPYEYSRDRDRDAAHYAISGILEEELEKPAGWDLTEVFTTARNVLDDLLFARYATDCLRNAKYRPLVIPLLVEAIGDPEVRLAYVWARIIKEAGPAAKAALPTLQRLADETPYADSRKDFNDAMEAITGSSSVEKGPQPVPGTGSTLQSSRAQLARLPERMRQCQHVWIVPPEGMACHLCGKVERIPLGCKHCALVLCHACLNLVQ